MGWWSPLSRQLLLQLSRHPRMQTYVRHGMSYMSNHPSAKKTMHALSGSWTKARRQFEQSVSSSRLPRGERESFSSYSAWLRDLWKKHRSSILSFIAVNFMGIIFFIQCGSTLWAMLKQSLTQIQHEKRIKKKESDLHTEKLQRTHSGDSVKTRRVSNSESVAEDHEKVLAPSPSFSFADGSEHEVQKSMKELEHDFFGTSEKTDFSTSFKFRMSEEAEFRSSLKDTAVMGESF